VDIAANCLSVLRDKASSLNAALGLIDQFWIAFANISRSFVFTLSSVMFDKWLWSPDKLVIQPSAVVTALAAHFLISFWTHCQ